MEVPPPPPPPKAKLHLRIPSHFLSNTCGLHNDVVDWDMNELHKEPNEPHDGETHCCCHCDALELYSGEYKTLILQSDLSHYII